MKINQAAELAGITSKNIRFYENQGLIAPARDSSNGYRDYSMEDVEQLCRIKLLRMLGISCENIRRLQSGELDFDTCMDDRMAELEKTSSNIEHMKTMCRMLQRDSDKVVEHTKSHEDRDVLLTDAALDIIEVARAYQEEHGCKGEYILSTTEEALSYAETNILLKKYCKRLNILYRSSHKSRKTYISSLIDAGININTIRSYAGHADERTTYFNYCFDRAPDAEKKMLLEKALETPLPR